MSIQSPLGVFRGYAIQSGVHVYSDVGVEVFVQAQRTARVLDEQVQHANGVVFDLGQLPLNLVGDEIRPTGLLVEMDGSLRPG